MFQGLLQLGRKKKETFLYERENEKIVSFYIRRTYMCLEILKSIYVSEKLKFHSTRINEDNFRIIKQKVLEKSSYVVWKEFSDNS